MGEEERKGLAVRGGDSVEDGMGGGWKGGRVAARGGRGGRRQGWEKAGSSWGGGRGEEREKRVGGEGKR